ncbi:MAG: hypothetical protein JWO85_983 [Candidatus Eremiobacteraeota bacterium]|jgi:anti-anti-sigma factor|nr:hypothetical protein [Candidatus Eremiobacteraeota bacterium]
MGRRVLLFLEVRIVAALRVVSLSGDLDTYTLASTRQLLSRVDGPCVIDLTDVRIIDAATLGEIVRLKKRLAPQRVVLAGANRHVRRVLAVLQFERMFEIVERPEDASAS